MRAGVQGGDEVGDLHGVHGPVGVDHDDVVTGRRLEAGGQGVALAAPGLGYDHQPVRGHEVPGDRDRVVAGVAVDEDDLEQLGQVRQQVLEVAGRRAAIDEALARASAGSVVAILGKGHERGQVLADRIIDFDDVEEATRSWRALTEEGMP